MKNRKLVVVSVAIVMAIAGLQGQARKGGSAEINPTALRQWLTYLSSDDLEGRETFSEGLGLAAAYIADQLRAGGVKPAGDHGGYFQRVSVLGVKSKIGRASG